VVFQRTPLRRHTQCASCPGLRGGDHRPDVAKHQAPSAPVVPPDYDGLLRTLRYRSIAPCSQPWGSDGFRLGLPGRVSPHVSVLRGFPASAPHTLRSFSLPESRPASPQPLPSRRYSTECHHSGLLDLTAFLLQTIRCRIRKISPCYDPLLPWACFPFKVLPSSSLPVWATPGCFRLSGITLGHAHRSGRALNVTDTVASV